MIKMIYFYFYCLIQNDILITQVCFILNFDLYKLILTVYIFYFSDSNRLVESLTITSNHVNLENHYIPITNCNNEDLSISQSRIRSKRNKKRLKPKLINTLLHEQNSPKEKQNRTME